MPISAVDAIGPAFEHAKQQLFKPFRFSQWTRLAFVGWLAGELGSGGGCNSGFRIPQIPHQSQKPFPMPAMDPGTLAALIAIFIVAGVILLVGLIYLNSMMRFVLFDSVVTRVCRIGESWRRRSRPGFRYFLWQICFGLAIWAILAIVVGIPVGFALFLGWFKDPQQHLPVLILGGIALFFFFFAFIVVILTVAVMTKDFVVPQMALEDISAVDAWRRLLGMMKAEKWSYAGYIGMKIILAIAAGIVVSIVSFISVLILVVLPFGGLGAIAILAGRAAGMGWNILTIGIAVVVGCIALAIILYLVCLIAVPVIVFFPAYSIYFFAARYPLLNNLLYPTRTAPPPPEPPPFLPPPQPIG